MFNLKGAEMAYFDELSEQQALNSIAPRGVIVLANAFPYTPPVGKAIKSLYIPDGTDVSVENQDGSIVDLTGWTFGRLDLGIRRVVSSTNSLYVILDN
jgi:hypothetical protein